MDTILDEKYNIVGKILTSKDLPSYIKLIEKTDTFWKRKLDTKTKDTLIENYNKKLLDSRFLCLGVFIENNLVLELSNFYPEKYPYWYNLSYLGNLTNYKNMFKFEYISSLYMINLSIEKGEALQYYSYYTLRPKNHQNFANRKFNSNRFSSVSHLSRYISFFEYCYAPEEKCRYRHHEILFHTFETYPENAYVYLHCLKPEFRIKNEL